MMHTRAAQKLPPGSPHAAQRLAQRAYNPEISRAGPGGPAG